MQLTHKERMLKAIHHEQVDRIPTQVNYTDSMGLKLAHHYGVPVEDVPRRLDNHMIRVDLNYPSRLSKDGKVKYDWWSVGFSTEEEGYFTSFNPMANSNDLDDFNWPDPHAPELFEDAQQIIQSDGNQHFITCNLGFCLFERAWTLRGYENFLIDLALDTKFAEELLDRICQIQLALIERFIGIGVDGGYFGDDYGAQKSLLISPKSWSQIIKPRLKKMFALFLDAGLPVIMHSDGQIVDILPEMVEIGLTVLNPVQPDVLNHKWLKDTFENKLAYYGGISTQSVLPHGSPQDVLQAVSSCVNTLAPDKTGLVISPSHRIMTDIPMENIDALLEAFSANNEYGQ
jgi:uroporphyrinogen decarboxylase